MLTIYKASAGSGKTYTLAYEYIKLLLGVRLDDGRYVLNHSRYLGGATLSRPHARILAITFTNKATAEMKDRIIGKLEALAHMPGADTRDADYADDLIACFGCTRSELCDVAARALRNLLNDYGRFNVSTIDAFFQTILRSFAREIDRQGDFRLELDERTVVSQAVSLLFDEINLDPDSPAVKPVAGWLDRMAAARMRDGKDFNPFNRGSSMYRDLVARLLQSFSEEFVARQNEMDEYLADPSRLNRFVQWLDDAVKALDEADCASAIAIAAVLAKNDPIANLTKYIDSIISARGIRGEALRKLAKPAKYQQALLDGTPEGLFKKGGRQPGDADMAAIAGAFASIVDNAYTRCLYAEILAKTDSLYAFN
ncbi:MAG: UvrD-helicase domain-containing protein, partial [Muribaculaceae bacterium]|nr:UvrD-helicase domain-containing protein [Muribaculaceae bacterium]